MCRSCGAIVGAGQTQCGVCGASTAAQPIDPAHRAPDRETVRFARAVLNRPYKFTIAFLVINLFVFLLMWESSGFSIAALVRVFPETVLQVYGAQQSYLINAPNRQWWRLITAMFIHVDLLHLLMNMFSLLILGPFVEKLYGSAKFVVLWVATGLAGSLAMYLAFRPSLANGILGSFIFKAQDLPAAGASGALFGLVGVLFVFGIKYRRELPEGFKRVFGTGLLPIIFINLFIGFLGRSFIGNAAHLGGLFTGAALAVFIDYRRPGARASINVAWRVVQVLCLALIGLGAYKVVRTFHRPIPSLVRANTNTSSVVFRDYVNAMNKVQEKVAAVTHKNDLSDLESVTQQAIQAPVPDGRAAELRSRLLVILANLAAAAAAPSPSPQKPAGEPPQLDQKLTEEFNEWRKEYNEWLKGAAKTYTGAP